MTIRSSIQWRLTALKNYSSKVKWETRRALDFSKKETVETISVVVVGRNDNYGGDFSDRLRVTLDWNLSHLPNPELIYIEWNPLPDKPSDTVWISERYENSTCYIVPSEIHNNIALHPEKMKVMEYFAKNLGIRKATSDWIMLVNADVFLGSDILTKIKRLNRDTIYGGHYVNIVWDKQPINERHLNDQKIIKTKFKAYDNFAATTGNLIMTHRKNWVLATGYDERLRNSRAGVDANGYFQLKHLGLKTEVLGDQFHLDHPESIVNRSNQENHGDRSFIDDNKNIPYKNDDSWGLAKFPLKKISEKIWALQKI